MVAATVPGGLLIPAQRRLWPWLIILIVLIIFAAIARDGITVCPVGELSDDRNRTSRSWVQTLDADYPFGPPRAWYRGKAMFEDGEVNLSRGSG